MTSSRRWLANREREKRHGARTYVNYNCASKRRRLRSELSVCAFARLHRGCQRLHDVARGSGDKLRQRGDQPLTELHIVNGLHRTAVRYYAELLRGFKRIRPDIHLKCFTAVEDRVLRRSLRHVRRAVLRSLMAAGLDSLPGGGAEIFAERVRRKIAHGQVRHRTLPRHPSDRAPDRYARSKSRC